MEKTVIRDCTLFCGNCLEMLEIATPGGVDVVWGDPPYGVGYIGNHRKILEKQEILANDEKPHVEFVPPIVKTVKDGGAIYLCTRFDVAAPWVAALEASGVKVKNPIFWVKDLGTQGDLAGDRSNAVEIILFAHQGRHLLLGKRVTNAWPIARAEPTIHPTTKPVELVRRCILASSDPGNVEQLRLELKKGTYRPQRLFSRFGNRYNPLVEHLKFNLKDIPHDERRSEETGSGVGGTRSGDHDGRNRRPRWSARHQGDG